MRGQDPLARGDNSPNLIGLSSFLVEEWWRLGNAQLEPQSPALHSPCGPGVLSLWVPKRSGPPQALHIYQGGSCLSSFLVFLHQQEWLLHSLGTRWLAYLGGAIVVGREVPPWAVKLHLKVGVMTTEYWSYKTESFAQLIRAFHSAPVRALAGAISAGLLTMSIWTNILSAFADRRPYYSQANRTRACKGDWGQTRRHIFINLSLIKPWKGQFHSWGSRCRGGALRSLTFGASMAPPAPLESDKVFGAAPQVLLILTILKTYNEESKLKSQRQRTNLYDGQTGLVAAPRKSGWSSKVFCTLLTCAAASFLHQEMVLN